MCVLKRKLKKKEGKREKDKIILKIVTYKILSFFFLLGKNCIDKNKKFCGNFFERNFCILIKMQRKNISRFFFKPIFYCWLGLSADLFSLNENTLKIRCQLIGVGFQFRLRSCLKFSKYIVASTYFGKFDLNSLKK